MNYKNHPFAATIEWFVDESFQSGQDIIIGIDPGFSGALAFLCGSRTYRVIDMPVIETTVMRKGKKQKGHEFDFNGICSAFQPLKLIKDSIVAVAIEQPPIMIKFGSAYAQIMINRAHAIWPLFLYAKGLPVENVSPVIWKKGFGLLKKDKEDSRKLAQSLFPKAPLSMKKDHGRAEALLIAEHIRRVHNGGK